MQDESPFAAVTRVLSKQFGIKPSNIQVAMLIEAVQEALPPHPEATIAALRAILRSLSPDNGLENWATRSARELTTWMAKQAQIRKIAVASGEGFWCHLEGTIAGMLMRVTRGKDLDT